MNDALERFHNNKDIFVELGIRADFDINKLHYAIHYRLMIERFGSTDNYNTEHTERLHIPFAKDAFEATNFKNEYPQMAIFVERKEKILEHTRYVNWYLAGQPSLLSIIPTETPVNPKMTKHATQKSVSLHDIVTHYEASMFSHAFAYYVVAHQDPNLTHNEIEARTKSLDISHIKFATYHKARFWLGTKSTHKIQSDEYDVVHARPSYTNTRKETVASWFDTVLVKKTIEKPTALRDFRVAQVKVIFTLPKSAKDLLPKKAQGAKYFAYVEWFKKFPDSPEPNHFLYQIQRSYFKGKPLASIIPLSLVHRSVHLIPKFDTTAAVGWKSDTVLKECSTFYVNSFTDRDTFNTII